MNGAREKIFCNLLRKSKARMQENFGGEFLIFIVISFWGLNFRLKRKLEKIFQLYMVQEVALLIQGQLLEMIA